MIKTFFQNLKKIYEDKLGITYRKTMYKRGYIYVSVELKNGSIQKGYLVKAMLRLFASERYLGELYLENRDNMIKLSSKEINLIKILDRLYLEEIKVGKND